MYNQRLTAQEVETTAVQFVSLFSKTPNYIISIVPAQESAKKGKMQSGQD